MARPRVSLVIAMARNGVIGRDHALPWHLPEDLRRFKATTLGKPILMGRRTFESIGRALPGRTNLVLTRDPHWAAAGAVVVRSLAQALAAAADAPELAVIGGAEIYRLALPLAERIYLTEVHADVVGDTFFSGLEPAHWQEVERTEQGVDARHAYPLSFVVLTRRAGTQPD